jgi:hypothetical protein
MKDFARKGRGRLLITASAAAAAVALASPAIAADTTVTPDPVPPPTANTTVNAHDIIDSVQEKILGTTATIADTVGGEEEEVTPNTASSLSVDNNSATANATALNVTNTIGLGLIENDGGAADGAGALAVQINFGAVSATLADGADLDENGDPVPDFGGNEIHALVQDFSSGSLEVVDNSMAANAKGNNASTSLAGPIPGDYTSTQAGSSTLSTAGPDWLVSTGSLSASTLQIQTDTLGPISNTATSSDSDILLSILNTVDDSEVIGSPVLDRNTIGASVAGNSSNSTIDIQSGDAPTFTGTAVVTNGQTNSSPDDSTSAIAAINEDSDIVATIAADDVNSTDDTELQGGLSVQDNAITSSASGNRALGAAAGQAGNRILIGNGMAFEGAATATPGADIGYDSGDASSSAAADLVINSSQGNVGSDGALEITATTDEGEIGAVVDDINAGSVTVAGNAITADASGNSASSAFASGDNMTSFTGSAAIANQQTNFIVDIAAEATGDVFVEVSEDDDTPESTILVDDNEVAATAYGNSASQSLSLDAVVQTLPLSGVTLTGGTDGTLNDGNVSTDGSLTVTNLQSLYDSDVSATEQSNIYVDAALDDEVVESSVGATNNTAEAIAVGSSGSNSLTLSGTTLDTGAGIASVQIADDSTVDAESEATVQINTADVDDSSLVVSGNLQRAIGYGGSVTNDLSVDGETVTADGAVAGVASTVTNVGGELAGDPQPLVGAGYGVLNVQSLDGEVSATAIPASWGSDAANLIAIDGDVEDSSVINGGYWVDDVFVPGNTLVAAGYGADAVNSASLDIGNLDTSNDDFSSVLNLTNVQEVLGDSSVTAQITGGALAATVMEDVTDSTVATDYNTAQAVVYGNRADNSVAVDGTNIDTEDDGAADTQGLAQVTAGGVATTDASFSLNNVQSVNGTLTASLLDDNLAPATSVSLVTVIDGDVIDSTISSDFNSLSSGATGNRADNSISVNANDAATTVALTNYQIDPTDISAFIGIEGGAPTPFIPGQPADNFNFTVTGTGLVHDNVNNDFDAGTLFVDTSSLGANEIAYLLTQGWSNGGPNQLTRSAVGWPATIGNYADIAGAGLAYPDTVPATSDTPATPGSPNVGGVTVAVSGMIDPSTVTVNSNSVSGSVTGNSASNSATLSGTNVDSGTQDLVSTALGDGPEISADGDVMLASRQQVSAGSDLTSEVYATFAIDTEEDELILDSTLEVNDNTQSSRAVANTIENAVTLEATNTTAGAALANSQTSRATVSSVSNVDIFAPVVSEGSSVSMSDNDNIALGVQNNAVNTLTVDATNSSFVGLAATDAVGDVDSVTNANSANADHVLLNNQYAEVSVSAEAVTTIYNDDGADLDTLGIVDGTVDVSGNTTTAEASSNRAVNIANVDGAASLTASAAVVNSQGNVATVNATATTSASITVSGDDAPIAASVVGSSITLGGNSTSSLARGNAASNALNYTAGATYGDGTGNAASATVAVPSGPAFDATVSAQAVVLNSQGNTGAVSASSTQSSYLVALNSADGQANITNATIGVIGNSVSAAAYGNTATNSLTLSALNTNQATAAVGNYQTNAGAVTASVTTVTYGITSGLGAVSGSALSVSSNAITATAVGNNAANSIGAGN